MLNKQKILQAIKWLACGVLAISLSGCYLSLGSSKKKGANESSHAPSIAMPVIVGGGGYAQPVQAAPQQEQPLNPVNR